jgi:outer membrane immunogenic protein
MRRYVSALLASTAIAIAATQMASAADLPVKSRYVPPPAPPPFSWTGFYIGGHGGAGWGTAESTLTGIDVGGFSVSGLNVPWSSHNINGWLAGATVGYNWQVNPWLVLGIEGDWTWADLEGTTPCGVANIFGCKTKVNWTADLTGRVGFAVDRALIYAKGGVVWADTDYSFNFLGSSIPGFDISGSTSDTRVGGMLGAGIEYAFLPNWSAKIEYNFMDFGTASESLPVTISGVGGAPPITAHADINQQIHVVKIGVNYRFDWGRM